MELILIMTSARRHSTAVVCALKRFTYKPLSKLQHDVHYIGISSTDSDQQAEYEAHDMCQPKRLTDPRAFVEILM